MRLIDADEIKSLLSHLKREEIFISAHWTIDFLLIALEQIDIIDPENLRPTGEWIPYHVADFGWDEYGVRCSNCNWKVEDDDIRFSMPFCPKCGKRMKKGR